LLNDRYSAEFKIDKATREKATSILASYYEKFPEDLQVSFTFGFNCFWVE